MLGFLGDLIALALEHSRPILIGYGAVVAFLMYAILDANDWKVGVREFFEVLLAAAVIPPLGIGCFAIFLIFAAAIVLTILKWLGWAFS